MNDFSLTSGAFAQGDSIPPQYTCDGDDHSPPLAWTSPPPGTVSFALLVNDPDAPAGDWVHWLLYNLPAETRSLPEGILSEGQLPPGTRKGLNDFGRPGYGGPCPPSGTHRYFFKLYALDVKLTLKDGAAKKDLMEAVKGHVLGQAELIGLYQRVH